MTYRQLDKECGVLAAKLGTRRPVFILAKNSIGALVGHLSCLNSGNVPLLLPNALDADLLGALLETYKPDFIWVPADMARNFNDGQLIDERYYYALIKRDKEDDIELHPDLAMLLPTSGSTGSPKLVRHSYNNLKTNIQAIIDYLDITENSRAITTLPVNYTYGLSVAHIHLMAGASVIVTDLSVLAPEFWKLVKEYSPTTMSGVPYTWEMLKKIRFQEMDLPSLSQCDQAGGKLPPDLQMDYVNWAQDKGKKFIVMYGQTEASPRMGYLPWDYAAKKYGSMGVAIPGGVFRLLDDNGNEITGNGEVGELIYLGPNVTMGYAYNKADLSKGDEWHGVLHTGDMAYRDEDGCYSIVGRKSRFLKLYGNRINLEEMERMINASFPGTACACVGNDKKMYVFIEGEAGDDLITDFIAQKTGLHHSSFEICKLAALPRNESGKIRYKELNSVYAEL